MEFLHWAPYKYAPKITEIYSKVWIFDFIFYPIFISIGFYNIITLLSLLLFPNQEKYSIRHFLIFSQLNTCHSYNYTHQYLILKKNNLNLYKVYTQPNNVKIHKYVENIN